MSTEEQHEERVEALEEEFIHNYSTDIETTCTICQAEFLDPEDLSIHLNQIHKITTPGTKLCFFCSHRYTDLIDFAEHFRDKHLANLFYCVNCLRAFSDEDERRLHEKKHSRNYKSANCCWQCTEHFGNLRDLQKHDLLKHNNNDEGFMVQPYFPYLSSVLKVKAETVLQSLHTDTVYICVSCSYSTSYIKHFIEHSRNKKCKVYACDKCSNVYKKKHSMKQHVLKCSGRSFIMIECPDCNHVFNKHLFKKHRKLCKVIKCYTCNTYYHTLNELTDHQSREHPLSVELKACNFCWKQCVGSVALQKHIDRSHKSELHLYKYQCIYCKIPFKHPRKLFGHFYTKHKDLEPYTCKICMKTFRLRKRFTLHIKLQHNSVGFVEFDENFKVFFTEKRSENPFIPKCLYEKELEGYVCEKTDNSSMNILNMNSEMSVTENEGNQTEANHPPKPTLKRKRAQKARKKKEPEIISVESSDEESLLVVKKRALKQQKSIPKLPARVGKWKQKQLDMNKKRFTCNVCNKYCYTYQNYNHHVSLHSKIDNKKCIKCSKVFRSKEKLSQHVALKHSSSKLTDTLKYVLEKRKKGEKITDDLPMSEKFRRTIKKVEFEEAQSSAKIKEVDDRLSVQKFIENFTPEAENRAEIVITNDVSVKVVQGIQREPTIKMTKFETKPAPTATKLSMPVKFKPSQYEKATASVRIVKKVSIVEDDLPDNDDNEYNFFDMDRNDSIPEVAEEVMLEGSEELPKITQIPHKIVIPNLPMEYKDLRIAHLLPQAPYYKIVKVDEVLNKHGDKIKATNNSRNIDLKLPDGTKLVSTNPLAHLLGKTSIEKVMEPMKNKYYKPKVRDFQGMLAEALSNLDKKKKKESKIESAVLKASVPASSEVVDPTVSEKNSQVSVESSKVG